MIISVSLVRGVFGAILLFLGRELNFVFSGGFAVLFAFRLLPLLPDSWPAWSDTAFIIGMGVIAAAIALTNIRFGYYVSGFLGGGFILVEYFSPGGSSIPLIPFFVGSVIGSLIMGAFTEWALMIISSVLGAFFIADLFILRPEVEMLISGALFLIGALVQVILWRMQRYADR